jgi:ankyrin repeat protein
MPSLLRRLAVFVLVALSALGAAGCGPEQKPFPEIDRAKLRIKLERTGCLDSCPRYQVSIDGQGNVVFDTGPTSKEMGFGDGQDYSIDTGVRVAGKYQTRITGEQVDAIITQFQNVGFFELEDEYVSQVTDNPTYVVSIDTGNGKKSVVDYAGEDVGMPAAVTRLEDAIDEAAGTYRWIKGTPDVIPLLKALDTDFSGVIGLELMDAAAERNDIATMARLKALGAPLNSRDLPKPQSGWAINPLRSAITARQPDAMAWLLKNGAASDQEALKDALSIAIGMDNHQAYKRISAAFRIAALDIDFKSRLLASAAGNADVAIVKDLLASGANPRGTMSEQTVPFRPLFEAASAGSYVETSHSPVDRRNTVAILLKSGAEAQTCQNHYCETALFNVSDPVIAEMLIKAGANPNFRDDEGEHILFGISDDDVAMVLIAHGADLEAVRPADGMTLGRWARYQGWRRVVDMLNRKGL